MIEQVHTVFPSAIIEVGGDKSSGHNMSGLDRIPIRATGKGM